MRNRLTWLSASASASTPLATTTTMEAKFTKAKRNSGSQRRQFNEDAKETLLAFVTVATTLTTAATVTKEAKEAIEATDSAER